jgi:hypothetical protein
VSGKGKFIGRVLSETFPNDVLPEVTSRVLISEPVIGKTRYFDAAGFAGWTVGLSSTPVPGPTC